MAKKKDKFGWDEEDAKGMQWDISEDRQAELKSGEADDGELTDEEREFLEWSDEMDKADSEREEEVKARQDGLRDFRRRAKAYLEGAVGSRFDGLSTVDLARRVIAAAPGSAPTGSSDSYVLEFARARLDELMPAAEVDPDDEDELEEEQADARDELREDGFNPDQPRAEDGKFSEGGGSSSSGDDSGGDSSGEKASSPRKVARVKSKSANKASDRALSAGNSAQAHEHDRASELHDAAAEHHEKAGNSEEASLHREAANQHRNLGSLNTGDLGWAPDGASAGRALRHAAKYRKAAKEAVGKIRELNKAKKSEDEAAS